MRQWAENEEALQPQDGIWQIKGATSAAFDAFKCQVKDFSTAKEPCIPAPADLLRISAQFRAWKRRASQQED